MINFLAWTHLFLLDLKCIFQTGDNIGGTEIKVGQQTGEACVQACIDERIKDMRINGVTVYSNGSPGCWCEVGMSSVNSDAQYKTCMLKPTPEKKAILTRKQG